MTVLDVPLATARTATEARRVVIGDDHPMMREGLRRSLEAFGIQVLSDVGNGREAVAAVEKHRPDVALLDLWMPIMDGIRATEIIRTRHPEVVVALLTFDTTESMHARALAAGAARVITKDTDAAELATILDGLGRCEVTGRPSDGPSAHGELSLTVRELEVLDLIVKGASTTAIAASLYISVKTVKNHLASIYEKLDVGDRTQAVLCALRLGLLSLDNRMSRTTYGSLAFSGR